jgi:hypothetical protein
MTNKRKAAMEEGESIPDEEAVSAGAEAVETAQVAETAKEETAVIDVHDAHHAASSWKEFFIHIATIVLGLLIAVGLEQGVEWMHHRREVAAVREELRAEREYNIDHFKNETANWRWETVELENNLMVLAYLQKHPGTADEKLPGSLVWGRLHRTFSEAAWDAAKSSGVTSLMPREEVAGYEYTYRQLKGISDADDTTWDATNDAERYDLTDSQLSQLDAAQIREITRLTQIVLTKQWLEGVALESAARYLKDFPPSVTGGELNQVRHLPSFADQMKDPAFALTMRRMEAAGYPAPAAAAASAGGGGKK